MLISQEYMNRSGLVSQQYMNRSGLKNISADDLFHSNVISGAGLIATAKRNSFKDMIIIDVALGYQK